MHKVRWLTLPLALRNVSDTVFANSTNFLTVPPRGTLEIEVAQLTDPDALEQLQVQVLNAFTAPDVPIDVTSRRAAD